MSDSPVSLTPFGMTAAIAAIVLGFIGVVGTVIQTITSIVGGGLQAFGIIFMLMSDAQAATSVMLWDGVTTLVGLLIYLVGFLLCLGAVGAGIFGLVKKNVGPVAGMAILIVVFDLLAHLGWPILNWIGRLGALALDADIEVALGVAGLGLVGVVVGLLWSLFLTLLWGVIAGLAIYERRQQAALLA